MNIPERRKSQATSEQRKEAAHAACLFLRVYLATIVGKEARLSVTAEIAEETTVIHIETDRIGAILGKKGRLIDALRILVDSIAGKYGCRMVIATLHEGDHKGHTE